jgi:hypothetical protein
MHTQKSQSSRARSNGGLAAALALLEEAAALQPYTNLPGEDLADQAKTSLGELAKVRGYFSVLLQHLSASVDDAADDDNDAGGSCCESLAGGDARLRLLVITSP